MTPLKPADPRFPRKAPSKFSLQYPGRGSCQDRSDVAGCYCCRGELELVAALMQNTVRIRWSFAEGLSFYSVLLMVRVVSRMFFIISVLIWSIWWNSSWNILLFLSFHIDQTMKPGLSHHRRLTVSWLVYLVHQLAMLSWMESLFLFVCRKISANHIHRLLVHS